MKTDILIKIFIADEKEPIFISQKALTNASEWFSAAFRNERLGNEPGVLRFPEDDLEAWKLLICWVMEGVVLHADNLNDCESIVLIQAWCLGHKYLVPDFQDLIMLELLSHIQLGGAILVEAITEAFLLGPADSLLTKLMAECAVELLKVHENIGYE